MKTTEPFLRGRYEAPVCDLVDCLQDQICAVSVGGTTDDYNDGGDFNW